MITVFMPINRFILAFTIKPLLHFNSFFRSSLRGSHLLLKIPIKYRLLLKFCNITSTVPRQCFIDLESFLSHPFMLCSNPSLFSLKQMNEFMYILNMIYILLYVVLFTFLTINILMFLTHHIFYNSLNVW
jgi:hypothetical protein